MNTLLTVCGGVFSPSFARILLIDYLSRQFLEILWEKEIKKRKEVSLD